MTTAIVELDLYSGAPNPTWTLDARATRELFDAIAALPPAIDARDLPGRLGYRGLVVRSVDDDRLPLHVADGSVYIGRDPVVETRFDPARRIERGLLASGAGTIDDLLLAALLASLDPP